MLALAFLLLFLTTVGGLLSIAAIRAMRIRPRTCPHGVPVAAACRTCLEEASERHRQEVETIIGGPLPDGTSIGSTRCAECGELVLIGQGHQADQVICRNGHPIQKRPRPTGTRVRSLAH